MDRNSVVKKSICALLVVLVVMAMTGCNDFMISLNTRRANKCVMDFIEATDAGLLNALNSYSREEIEAKSFIDEQQELYVNNGNCEFEIIDIYLDDEESMDVAICELSVTAKNSKKVLKDLPSATYSDYNRKLKKAKTKTETFELKMTSDNGEWKFDDLTPLYEKLYKPYEDMIVLDDMGIAINPGTEYYKEKFVSVLWYDPLSAVPLTTTSVTSPVAIQCGFYFDRPITDTLVAKLYDESGKAIASKEITLEVNVLVICDFSLESVGVSKFSAGSYDIKLFYGDEEICSTSESLTVK
ncbi:MAG: hypothetical protein MJ166_00195 [Clostridia bacterium]|nr:hypothetical protein [Clostridia bacterium]